MYVCLFVFTFNDAFVHQGLTKRKKEKTPPHVDYPHHAPTRKAAFGRVLSSLFENKRLPAVVIRAGSARSRDLARDRVCSLLGRLMYGCFYGHCSMADCCVTAWVFLTILLCLKGHHPRIVDGF